MTPRVTMRKALADPALLGSVLKGDSWYGWRVLLIASAGEELTDDERVIFTKITGRGREPGVIIKELVAIFGRRAGKSLAMACFLVWIAGLCDHRGAQAPGETLIALVLSRDQRISKSLLNYVEGIVQNSPLLRSLIVNRTADTIELQHHVQITVRPCNAISPRGLTLICAVLDEISFWFTSTDYADPDVEILAALRPTLLTTKGPILMASSVYAKVGVLYDAYKQYYGAAGPSDILVGFGTSRDMNPLLSQAEIDRELERDPLRNRAEYLSEWRDDVEGFISREIVEACIGDYHELPPQDNISYSCFVDAASGVPDGDSYAAAISYRSGDQIVVAAIREVRAPFSPASVVTDIIVPLCRAFRVHKVWGDAFAGQFAREPFRLAGLGYELVRPHKSELYRDPMLPLLNSKKLVLPRNPRAINQICGLECSTQRSGRDEISHPVHAHDDIANAIAGAAHLSYQPGSAYSLAAFQDDFVDRDTDAGRSDAVKRADEERRTRVAQLNNALNFMINATNSPYYWGGSGGRWK